MRDPRFAQALNVEPIFPNNGLPPRPGEDRPGLSAFGRLAMGGTYGKSSILVYNHHENAVQQAGVDMIVIEGDDFDAQQLVVTLHPPRIVPLCYEDVVPRLDLNQQNLTNEQTNAEIGACDFPGTDKPVSWPPLEALIEFGVGGVSTKVVVDYVNGMTISVIASYLRVSALVTQSKHCGDIYGTSAAYHLAAHIGPGYSTRHAQRTIFVGEVDNCEESDVFDLPRFAKAATLMGTHKGRHHHHHHEAPVLPVGWIRFFQSPDGTNCVGDFFVSDPQMCIEVPNAAQYFSVFNQSGHKMKMAVIFELAL